MEDQIKQQYEGLYGPFVPGDYAIGEIVRFDGGASSGEVIWSCTNEQGKFCYIVDDGSGFPVPLERNELVQGIE